VPSVEACEALLGVLLGESGLVKGFMRRVLETTGDPKALSDVLVGDWTIPDELDRRMRRDVAKVGVKDGLGLGAPCESLKVVSNLTPEYKKARDSPTLP